MTMEEPTDGGNVWELLVYPDKRLRSVASPIKEITDSIKSKCLALAGLMRELHAVGLAATQVGWDARVLVINLTGDKENELIFINPVVVRESSAQMLAAEFCLSLPGISGRVARPREVSITATNLGGDTKQFDLDGMLARCFLHEMAHLDGQLFVDRLSSAKKLSLRRKLNKLEDHYGR